MGVEGVSVMARGKGGGSDDWGQLLGIVIGVGIGAFAVYYLTAGRGQENAALIPDDLEGRIDFVVEALNRNFGQGVGRSWFECSGGLPQRNLALADRRIDRCNLSGGAAIKDQLHEQSS